MNNRKRNADSSAASDLSPIEIVPSAKRMTRVQSGGSKATVATSNGSMAANGSSKDSLDLTAPLGERGWINKKEYIRLLEQSLQNLGFQQLARQLEQESGVRCQSEDVMRLRQACLDGDWALAVTVLDKLHFPSKEQQTQAKFVVLEQKYLEALHSKEYMAAVRCLRTELSALNHNSKRVQRLASAILCSPQELQLHATWAAGVHASRQQLLRELQAIVPPEEMLPERRLEVLLEQALESQLTHCPYFNAHHNSVPMSLLADYQCGREQIPTCTTQVLLDHADEVWHLAFSHSGRYLATASKDATAIIWTVEGRRKVIKKFVLRDHTDAIVFLAWSPNDEWLATCGNDNLVKIWHTDTGELYRSLNHHSEAVTCVAWLPDSRKVITGTNKRMMMVDINGQEYGSWKRRVADLAVSHDGRRCFSISSISKDCQIHIIDLEDNSERHIQESAAILSMSISADGKYLLVNLHEQTLNLWELPPPGSDRPMPAKPVQSFKGLRSKQGRYVVRSCCGGYREAFVLSGSEESKVFVWHRESGEKLAELEGHAGCVNSVAWNPVLHHIFASASDDRSVHIWSVTDEVARDNGLE